MQYGFFDDNNNFVTAAGCSGYSGENVGIRVISGDGTEENPFAFEIAGETNTVVETNLNIEDLQVGDILTDGTVFNTSNTYGITFASGRFGYCENNQPYTGSGAPVANMITLSINGNGKISSLGLQPFIEPYNSDGTLGNAWEVLAVNTAENGMTVITLGGITAGSTGVSVQFMTPENYVISQQTVYAKDDFSPLRIDVPKMEGNFPLSLTNGAVIYVGEENGSYYAYEFKGWNVNGTVYTTDEEVQNAVAELVMEMPDEPVVVKAVIEQKISNFMTVVGGTAFDYCGTEREWYQFGEEVYIVPDNGAEEQIFYCWTYANYNVPEEVFEAHMSPVDLTVIAVYGDETNEPPYVPDVPVIKAR